MTNSTSEETSVESTDKVQQIADLFIEDEKEETQDSGSPDDVESDDLEAEEESETEAEPDETEQEEEVTWSGVLGVDESKLVLDEDGNFKGVKIKVDGRESDVDLNTLIAGYQTAKHTTQKSQALSEERRKFEQEREQTFNVFQNKIKEADGFIGLLEKKLESDYQDVDLAKLRATNPGEYAAIIAEQYQRRQDIAKMREAINANQNALDQIRQEEQNSIWQKQLSTYAEKALTMFPEWNDPAKAQADFLEMRSFVKEFGFSEEEFDSVVDPRMLAVVKRVMDGTVAAKESEKKLSKPVPNIRTSRRSRTGKRTSKLDRLVKRAKSAHGSQKRVAQTDAIAALLLGEE